MTVEELRVAIQKMEPEVAAANARHAAVRETTLDRLWSIFNTSVIKPEAASFVVGRMYEAFADLREITVTLKKFAELQSKLVAQAKAEAGVEKAPKRPGLTFEEVS